MAGKALQSLPKPLISMGHAHPCKGRDEGRVYGWRDFSGHVCTHNVYTRCSANCNTHPFATASLISPPPSVVPAAPHSYTVTQLHSLMESPRHEIRSQSFPALRRRA
jgi:hypothetical protein